MTSEPRRRLTLVDATLLIAAIAVGLSFARGHASKTLSYHQRYALRPAHRLAVATPYLASSCAAFLLLRVIGGRLAPSVSEGRMGDALCLSATVGVLLGILTTALGMLDGMWYNWIFKLKIFENVPMVAGPAVLGTWAVCAFNGLARASDWLDTASRVVAAGWVVLYLLMSLPNSWAEWLLSPLWSS